MPEHYTRNTLEATYWCKKCHAMTQHRVDDGRKGPCLDCLEKLRIKNEVDRIQRGLKEEQQRERDKQNPKLW